MNFDENFIDFGEIFNNLKDTIIGVIPEIFGTLLILLCGYLIAVLLRSIARRLILNTGRLMPNQKFRNYFEPDRMKESARLISNILYWIVIAVFITIATEFVGLPILSVWLGGVLSYLPKVFIAGLILMSGFVGATVVQNLLQSATHSAGIEQSALIGRIGRYLVWLLTILIGVDQLGIEITLLVQMILIILAAMLLSGALAFGFGAKDFVSDILASNYLQRTYQVGDQIKIGDITGKIIKFSPISVIIDSADGHVSVPAKKFNELTSTLIGRKD